MITAPIWIRSLVDGLAHREQQRTVDHRSGMRWDVDQAHRVEPLKLPSRQRTTIDPLVTVHVTDVTGGFGVAARHKHRFAEALADRYTGVAYHAIASRRIGTVRNHSIWRRTSHGNGGNRGAGWAVDCGHAEPLSPELAATAYRSLVLLVLDVHEATGETVVVVPHRVFSAGRRADPGPIVWGVVRQVVDALGPSLCRVDYTMREAGGLPVPRSWDPAAAHDDKGKRLG